LFCVIAKHSFLHTNGGDRSLSLIGTFQQDNGSGLQVLLKKITSYSTRPQRHTASPRCITSVFLKMEADMSQTALAKIFMNIL